MPKPEQPEEPEAATGFTYIRAGHEREAEVEAPPSQPDGGEGEQRSVSEPEPEADEVEDDGDEYPEDGTIPAVKRWIGDDVDRAQVAYEAEQERETPRSTLLEFLEDMLSEPDDEE